MLFEMVGEGIIIILASKPNVILINCDDLGYGDLGCYGSEVHKTPALDRIAQEGVRFTNFYMPAAVCSPSRGGMMTGSYPKRIGFGSFNGLPVLFPGQGLGLNPREYTLPEALKREGYATMLVGKWHCGDQPEFLPDNHGFDHYYGLPYSNDMGRQIGREEYPPLPLMLEDEVLEQQPDQTSLTLRYLEQSIRFIRQNKHRPFFLNLAHMYVHLPLYVPDRFLQESQNGPYGAAVECIDWVTDVLLYELKSQGIDRNTLVIFTSDNGSRNADSNRPLRGVKGTTWEGGMRVPCIMYWPGVIPAETVCDETATSMDFLPTLTRLAGGRVPDNILIDGKDIRPLMLGEINARTPYKAFFYYRLNNLEAVRAGKWKLYVRRFAIAVKELYDLENDIGETANVYYDHPMIVEKLETYAQQCREDLGDEATGIEGRNVREIGRVEHPKTLTSYNPDYPYYMAIYDTAEFG